MKIYPSMPYAFSHVGQRTNNQDALYPLVDTATEESHLFIVCDGMGGADKGEIASQVLRDEVVRYAAIMDYPVFDAVHMQAALDQAYEAYRTYLRHHPLVNRMGSTLALLQLHEQGVTIAHIGDSRIYQFRNGKLIFQTRDHRQVNDMVEAGIITAVQALTHPWRNRLSRAVVVESADKKESARVSPECVLLTDIQLGDTFFICTDGVLEAVDNHALAALITSEMPDQAKVQTLVALCNSHSKDNYSGYLLSIQRVLNEGQVTATDTVKNYVD